MVKKLISNVEEVISVSLLFALLIVLFAQVFTRFVLNDPATWTEEMSRLLFIYSSLFGISAAIKTRSHVRIQFFTDKMPFVFRSVLAMVLDAVVVITLIALVYLGYQTAMRQHILQLVSLPLPMSTFYAGFPVACALMAARLVQRTWCDAIALRNGTLEDDSMQKPRV